MFQLFEDLSPAFVRITESVDETFELGKALGCAVQAGDTIALIGEIGSGKTHFTQGLGYELGVTDALSSPTFAFINEYEGRIPLMHADLYRLQEPAEIAELGIEEYFSGSWVVVIEWADIYPKVLPAEHLAVYFQYEGNDTRSIGFYPFGKRYRDICNGLEGVTTNP